MKLKAIHRFTAILMIIAFIMVGMMQFHHHHCDGETHIALIGADFNITKGNVGFCSNHDHIDHHSEHNIPLPGGPLHDCDHTSCALHLQSSIADDSVIGAIPTSILLHTDLIGFDCSLIHSNNSIIRNHNGFTILSRLDFSPSTIDGCYRTFSLRGPPIC